MTDDYTKARAKLREAEVTSNLDSDADGGNERDKILGICKWLRLLDIFSLRMRRNGYF